MTILFTSFFNKALINLQHIFETHYSNHAYKHKCMDFSHAFPLFCAGRFLHSSTHSAICPSCQAPYGSFWYLPTTSSNTNWGIILCMTANHTLLIGYSYCFLFSSFSTYSIFSLVSICTDTVLGCAWSEKVPLPSSELTYGGAGVWSRAGVWKHGYLQSANSGCKHQPQLPRSCYHHGLRESDPCHFASSKTVHQELHWE